MRALISICFLLLITSPTAAQVYPSPLQKWAVSSRSFTTSNLFFSNEKIAMMTGMSSWNAIGTSFTYTDGGFSSYNPPANGPNAADRPCDSQSGIGATYYVASTAAADARTCIKLDTATVKTITDGDIWLNLYMVDRGEFFAGTGTPPSTQVDLQSAIVHEFGHLLKLDHDSYSSSVVMYRTLSKGTVRRVLHTRDRNGKMSLYP